MFGLIVLALSAIGWTYAALSILGHPGGLWVGLLLLALANGAALVGAWRRATWGRWLTILVLIVEIVVVAGIVLLTVVFANAFGAGGTGIVALVLGVFAAAVLILAGISLGNLEWPDR